MNQEEIKKLAIEHKLIDGYDGDGLVAIDKRLIAYTAAVEAPLQARIAQLEEALKAECGDRCNAEYNPCAARQLLNDSPSTRLSYLGETK